MSEYTSPEDAPGLKRQRDVYEQGLAGVNPSQPVSPEALEAKARQELKQQAFEYLAGGAGGEDTLRANREAFFRRRIVPRFLRDVARRDLGVELLGRRQPAPLLLAPVGVQGILHRDGELASARAAAALGLPFVLSTVSSYTLEEVARASGEGPRWFQLYWPADRALAASFLRRAEAAGYEALVVTLDTYLLSWRERDIQNAYLPFLRGEGLANYLSDPVFHEAIGGDPAKHPVEAVRHFTRVFADPSLTWSDLPFLRQHTRLPVVLKGILHGDDARRAVECGADAIIVSNHGGRQVDGAVAALDAMPHVVEAVSGRVPVLFDSGIRRGADVFKALALGAKAVLVGRPYCFGLAVNGEAGVRDVLLNLIADFDLTLGLAGCRAAAQVGPESVIEAP